MVDKTIAPIVRRYLQSIQAHGIMATMGVVFGSQATGHAGAWSDIDLVVISPQFDGTRNRADINLLWRIAARTDSRIEPIPCGEKQWREDTSSAIIEIARREGEEVLL